MPTRRPPPPPPPAPTRVGTFPAVTPREVQALHRFFARSPQEFDAWMLKRGIPIWTPKPAEPPMPTRRPPPPPPPAPTRVGTFPAVTPRAVQELYEVFARSPQEFDDWMAKRGIPIWTPKPAEPPMPTRRPPPPPPPAPTRVGTFPAVTPRAVQALYEVFARSPQEFDDWMVKRGIPIWTPKPAEPPMPTRRPPPPPPPAPTRVGTFPAVTPR